MSNISISSIQIWRMSSAVIVLSDFRVIVVSILCSTSCRFRALVFESEAPNCVTSFGHFGFKPVRFLAANAMTAVK